MAGAPGSRVIRRLWKTRKPLADFGERRQPVGLNEVCNVPFPPPLSIDFAAINREALPLLPAVFAACCPTAGARAANTSRSIRVAATATWDRFKINLRTGVWADFASRRQGRRSGLAGRLHRRLQAGRGRPEARPDARPRWWRSPPWMTIDFEPLSDDEREHGRACRRRERQRRRWLGSHRSCSRHGS